MCALISDNAGCSLPIPHALLSVHLEIVEELPHVHPAFNLKGH